MAELLFISGSFGLGHVFRDLAIAHEIRRLRPDTRISWMAGDPARQVLADAGETLLPEAAQYASDSDPAEAIAQNMHANLVQYALQARQSWLQNVRLFRLAAADLAIVHGGGSITLELTALRTPFLFFPVEGHSEQEVSVATRIARHGAGVRMAYSQTTPEALAEAARAQMGREVTYPPIPTDGARVAAELIVQQLAA